VVLRRKLKGRARLTNSDRWFFVQLYCWFPSILVVMIVRPGTLVRWHRAGFRRYVNKHRIGNCMPNKQDVEVDARQVDTEFHGIQYNHAFGR
jgi:hypothetical protein